MQKRCVTIGMITFKFTFVLINHVKMLENLCSDNAKKKFKLLHILLVYTEKNYSVFQDM